MPGIKNYAKRERRAYSRYHPRAHCPPVWNTVEMTLLKKLLRLYWKAVTSPLTEEERDEFFTFGM